MSQAKPLKRISRFLRPFERPAPLSSAEAFSDLYRQHHLAVYRYIFGLRGGPQEEVEDLTAETFTRAWKARFTFEGEAESSLGWLLKIARRLVIDAYRRDKARGLDEEAGLSDLPGLYGLPEDQVLAGEQRRTLWALLQGLPDGTREMLVLRYLLGWRVNQIACYLEIPENTVSVSIRRALKRLQSEWPHERGVS